MWESVIQETYNLVINYMFTTSLYLRKTLRTHSKTKIPTESLNILVGHPVGAVRASKHTGQTKESLILFPAHTEILGKTN